jgi:hypothetical protein
MNDHHLSELTDFPGDTEAEYAHIMQEMRRFYGFDEAITHALQRPLPSLWERLCDWVLTWLGR